jgi:hypothetical protein
MRYDIALNNGDLYIKNDDFIFAQSDTQHVIDTINAFAGWWKENPLDGVGLMAYIKSNTNAQQLNRKISIELEADGYKTSAPVVTLSVDGQLTINPNAEPI